MEFSCHLLSLPPEIRDNIYCHLFEEQQTYPQRTPSRKRLRCSQQDKNDTRGILQTSKLLRAEAIPRFYRKNVLVFRNSDDLLEYVDDENIDDGIKANVMRVAIDVGDVWNCESLKLGHLEALAKVLVALPRLQWLETRIYTRTDCAPFHQNYLDVFDLWQSMRHAYNVDDFNLQKKDSFAISHPEYVPLLQDLRNKGIEIRTSTVRCVYWQENGTPPTNATKFKECNLLLSKGLDHSYVLFGTGVAQRMAVAGAIPIEDRSLLDGDAWDDDRAKVVPARQLCVP